MISAKLISTRMDSKSVWMSWTMWPGAVLASAILPVVAPERIPIMARPTAVPALPMAREKPKNPLMSIADVCLRELALIPAWILLGADENDK